MKNTLLIISLSLFLSPYVLSQTIVTERPTQSESAITLPKNSFQIESGMILYKGEEANLNTLQIAAPSTLFRYGIAKRFEIRFISEYLNQISFAQADFPNIVSGFSDIQLGTKIQLFKKDGSSTEIAFLTHLSIPTGSELFSNLAYLSISKVAVSHTLTEYLGIGYNLGYKYIETGESSLIYSLGLGLNVNQKFGFFVEPYGELNEFTDHVSNINGGIIYKLNDHFQADFSFGTGINNNMNFYGVGFAWNISRENISEI